MIASDDTRALGAFATAATLALHPFPALATSVGALRPPLGIVDRVEANDAIALTFDDGPHPQGTLAVLELLARADVKATFFLVGEQVERRPGLAAEIAASGHALGLHCHRHRSTLRLTPTQLEHDLTKALHAITQATGRLPSLYRPPYGVFSAAALAFARRRHLCPMLWTRWGRDWAERATAESIHRLLTRRLRPGDVLLLHDADYYSAPESWRNTVAALPRVLETLSTRKLRTTLPAP